MSDVLIEHFPNIISDFALLIFTIYVILRYPYDYHEPHDPIKTEAADEIDRLREALKFYANWSVVSAYIDDEIEEDRGDKARAALKERE